MKDLMCVRGRERRTGQFENGEDELVMQFEQRLQQGWRWEAATSPAGLLWQDEPSATVSQRLRFETVFLLLLPSNED